VSQSAAREGSKGDSPAPASGRERLGVAGAGTIACDLAACVAAQADPAADPVVLWARSDRSAGRARERVAASCEKLERPDAAARVCITEAIEDLRGSTIVVEAVREDERVKRHVLEHLGGALPAEVIIATTTSSLSVSTLARASGRPARFFGLHVFNPVHRMLLVELCFPPEAEAETKRRATALCEAIGKVAVTVPDEPGFVVNRLLFPFLFDAVRLLERTGLGAREIDTCMKLGASHAMGPLELLDLVGIDVAEAIGEALYADSGDAAHRPPGRIKELVGEGRLGRKAGAGFYDYG
jgi:3-hydroxybutyryl-CoA dehydrogenase